MIRPALQLFASLTLRNAKIVSPAVSNILLRRPVIYNFCKDQDKHQEKHQEKQDKKHTEKQEQDKQKET